VYDRPFYIEDPVSNNAFSYEKRANKRLFVPSLVEGTFEEVKTGCEIAFEDFDDDGVLRSCTGLLNFVRMEWRGKPVYVFDNHNHSFAFWHLEAISGRLKSGVTLLHMDMHRDSRSPARFLSPAESCYGDAVSRYTNTVLDVGNFVLAAVKTGLAGKVVNLDGESSMREFNPSALKTGNIIFDLDLDIFAPEMDYIDIGLKLGTIRMAAGKSAMVTIATSPFFIEQDLALKRLRAIAEILSIA
jgi:hypothetical protein